MKILVILLAPLGLVGGLAAGHFAAPTPPDEPIHEELAEKVSADQSEDEYAKTAPAPRKYAPKSAGESDYAKLDKQFVVPIVEDETVAALVVVTMAIEVSKGSTDVVYLHEPKLRDEFLSVLFNHGRSGAFHGVSRNCAS
jgi:flagellar FliL protein